MLLHRPHFSMPPTNRRGRGGLAASKLASAYVDTNVTPIPPVRTSWHHQPSTSLLSLASTSTHHPLTDLSRASTSTAESQKQVGAPTVSASRMSLFKEFDSFSDQGVNSNEGSFAKEKVVESDVSSDNEESDKKEEEEKGSDKNQLNGKEIEDAVEFFSGKDDDSLGGVGDGCNDYSEQDYNLFDRVWHWMAPSTIIKNEKTGER